MGVGIWENSHRAGHRTHLAEAERTAIPTPAHSGTSPPKEFSHRVWTKESGSSDGGKLHIDQNIKFLVQVIVASMK